MIQATPDGVRIRIRLVPRASRDQVMGEHGGALRIAITAPPVEGKANKHLTKFLAKRLGLPPNRVSIAAGELSRDKVVVVTGIDAETATARLLGAD